MPSGKTRTTRPARSASAARGDARRDQQRRRGRVIFIGALLLSVAMLVAWFPTSTLLAQRHEIAASSSLLANLKAQDRALLTEQAKLSSPLEVARLAREEYQLVQPGQKLVQVLPPAGAATPTGAGQAPYPGDPGLSAPVRPSAIALLPTGEAAAVAAHPSAAKPTHGSSSVVSRILATLEFWRT